MTRFYTCYFSVSQLRDCGAYLLSFTAHKAWQIPIYLPRKEKSLVGRLVPRLGIDLMIIRDVKLNVRPIQQESTN